jgi:hypothetical protein
MFNAQWGARLNKQIIQWPNSATYRKEMPDFVAYDSFEPIEPGDTLGCDARMRCEKAPSPGKKITFQG